MTYLDRYREALDAWTKMRVAKHQASPSKSDDESLTIKGYTPECQPHQHGLDISNVPHYLDQVLEAPGPGLTVQLQLLAEGTRHLLRCTVLDRKGDFGTGVPLTFWQWQDHRGEMLFREKKTNLQGQVDFEVWEEYLPWSCIAVGTVDGVQSVEEFGQWLDQLADPVDSSAPILLDSHQV